MTGGCGGTEGRVAQNSRETVRGCGGARRSDEPSARDTQFGVEMMRIGRPEMEDLRKRLSYPDRDDLTDWEVVEIAGDELVAEVKRRMIAERQVAEAEAALAVQTTRIEAVEKLLASWQDEALYGHIEDRPVSAMRAELLAAALSAAADTDNPEERR